MSVIDDITKRYNSEISTIEIELLSMKKKKLSFSPITSKQEEAIVKQLEAENLSMLESVMDEVLNANCSDPGFDAKKIRSLDRIYIIVILYKNSRGDRFEARMNCPKCHDSSTTKPMKIDDFDLVECKSEEERVELKPFTIILHYPTRERDMESSNILTEAERDKIITMKHHSIAKYIVGCEISKEEEEPQCHSLNFKEALEVISILTPEDTKKLQDKVKDMDYGLELKTDFLCPKCEYTERDMPLTMVEFFLAY